MGQKNQGYITVEASMVIPVFLFFLLGMAGIYMTLMAEAHIHQALAAATDYVAGYSYLEYKLSDNMGETEAALGVQIEDIVNSALVIKQFHSYLGNDFYVERMLNDGKNGILITVKKDDVNDKIILVTASYQIKINLPLLGTHSINLSNQIKQKAFVGFSKEECNSEDYYVFVTPNKEAYHMRRNCTHLVLDVRAVSENQKRNYTPCYYCGYGEERNTFYIAKSGDVYHCSKSCVGLKRTVSRVKLSTVKGIGACSRCGVGG